MEFILRLNGNLCSQIFFKKSCFFGCRYYDKHFFPIDLIDVGCVICEPSCHISTSKASEVLLAFDQIIANRPSYETGEFIYFWANNGFLKLDFQVKLYHRLKACRCANLGSSARAIPAPPSIPQESQSTWHFHLSWAVAWERCLQLQWKQPLYRITLLRIGAEWGWTWQSLTGCSWLGCCLYVSSALSQTFFHFSFFIFHTSIREDISSSTADCCYYYC